MIHITGLHKQIVDGDRVKTVLHKLDLSLTAGQSLAISGDSGSGKSTLLHIIAALDKADAGHIRIADIDLQHISSSQADHFRKHQLGMVFQQFNLIDCLSVWDNLCFPARLAGIKPGDFQLQLLSELGLNEHKHKLPVHLSGGEQQRVAIARALAHKPSLVLADEPTGNLDDKNSGIVSKLLYGLCKKQGASLIVVTHSKKVAAQADRQLRMFNARLHKTDDAGSHALSIDGVAS
ncbi:MAG: putative ABC transport system ATP-binding protein [Paraglaciecola sp.]|jgi:putative ABC transport system ATP-binding protein